MKISEILEKYNIECSKEKEEKLKAYMEELLSINESINMTAIKEPSEFILRHYVDSLTLLNIKEYECAEIVLDLGTGGGFPGIPLAIFSPEKQFILMDSLNKRLKIIQQLAEKIGISNVSLVHGRAEDLGQRKEYRETLDLCVSRAVADLSVLSEYCLPFVSVGGSFVSYKGPTPEEELKKAEKAIRTLGGRTDRIEKTVLGQTLIVVKKEKGTPSKYPRKAGDPRRNPL